MNAPHGTSVRALACRHVRAYASGVDQFDALLRPLRLAWPGWQVWYVRSPVSRTVTWCALADAERDTLPMRTLNAASPEELSAAITARSRELAAR